MVKGLSWGAREGNTGGCLGLEWVLQGVRNPGKGGGLKLRGEDGADWGSRGIVNITESD